MIVLFDDVLSFVHVVEGFLSAFFLPIVPIFGGWEVYELIFGESMRIVMGDIVEFLVGVIAGTITSKFVEIKILEKTRWTGDRRGLALEELGAASAFTFPLIFKGTPLAIGLRDQTYKKENVR